MRGHTVVSNGDDGNDSELYTFCDEDKQGDDIGEFHKAFYSSLSKCVMVRRRINASTVDWSN